MNDDITFCADKDKCPQAATCRRAFPPSDVTRLWFANFKEQRDECLSYWPTGEKK